jgi:hypothetical protein
MSILDTLKKQAAAVTDTSKSAKVADLLRQAAALLEAEAPKRESFAITKKRKSEERSARLEKFGDANIKRKVEDRHRMLVAAGWSQGMRNDKSGEYWYGRKGVQIKIVGDSFSVVHGPATLQGKTNIAGLTAYVEKFKGQQS